MPIPTYPGHFIELGVDDPQSVKMVKEQLNLLYNTDMDTNNPLFGPTMLTAVMKFQKDHSLNPDGIIGSLTWKKLFHDDTVLPVFKPDINSRVLRFRAVQVAHSFLWVREKTGHNDGPEVEKFLHNVGLTKGYAWCQAFVYSNFLTAAQDLDEHNPVPMTGGVLNAWEKTKGEKVTVPMAGDVFVMDFGHGKGHTGHVTEVFDGYIHTIEGNTSHDPVLGSDSDREGDGVYERSRKLSLFKGFVRYQ